MRKITITMDVSWPIFWNYFPRIIEPTRYVTNWIAVAKSRNETIKIYMQTFINLINGIEPTDKKFHLFWNTAIRYRWPPFLWSWIYPAINVLETSLISIIGLASSIVQFASNSTDFLQLNIWYVYAMGCMELLFTQILFYSLNLYSVKLHLLHQFYL